MKTKLAEFLWLWGGSEEGWVIW